MEPAVAAKTAQIGKRHGLPARGALCYCPGKSHKANRGGAMRIDPKEGSPAMDYAEHLKTYRLFCKLAAGAIIGVVVVMAFLAVFVA